MQINVAMPLTSTVKLGQFILLRIQNLNASMYSLCLQSALCWWGLGEKRATVHCVTLKDPR